MNSSLVLSKVANDDSLLAVSLNSSDFSEVVGGWREAGLTVRVARGRKMAEVDKLMDEFAASLQFPYYFGENWPAFQECIEDMDWLPVGEGYVVAISDAPDVLSNAPAAELSVLIRSFAQARATYSSPVADGEWWDRPALPFHVVLQADSDLSKALKRWQDAGALLKPLELPV